MNFTFIGLGYVGLVNSVLLASFYHNVIGYDIDKNKIELLKQGVSTIEEPNLQTLLSEAKTKLRFTSNAQDAISINNIIVICVDTPNKNGQIDLTHFNEALDDIARYAEQDSFIIIRSTVPVGTNKYTKEYLESRSKYKFQIISMPEFMSESTAVYDTINPYRLVIGVNNQESIEFAQSITPVFLTKKVPVLITTPENAELIKLSSDAFIATKISFTNSLAKICEDVGADIDRVSLGLSLDPRIGKSFLKPGIGYGGVMEETIDPNCWILSRKETNFEVVKAAMEVNKKQAARLLDKIFKKYKAVSSLTIGVLGASYKANTEDIRNSAAIEIIRTLLDKGADIQLYDPLSMDKVEKVFSRHTHIKYKNYAKDAIKGTHLVLILTNADEFKLIKPEDYISLMIAKPVVIDAHNIYKVNEMNGIEYISNGRKSSK